ncbi:MAG: hypothetical protein WCL18_01400 [bacterium]
MPPSRIQRHSKLIMPGSKPDYAPASLMEKFSPVLVHMEPFDISTKKQIAIDIWKKKSQPNLFMTQEIVS